MPHLSAEELVDLVEGARPESSAPHLAVCDACRRQLAELRGVLSSTAAVDVPEPSPLFWDHLSARVREAVEAEGTPPKPSAWRLVYRPVYAGVFAVAVLAVALGWGMRTRQSSELAAIRGPVMVDAGHSDRAGPTEIGRDMLDAGDDLALRVVADLADMDLDTARDAGLAVGGSAEHAVTHLSGSELEELRRLLQAELGRRGA